MHSISTKRLAVGMDPAIRKTQCRFTWERNHRWFPCSVSSFLSSHQGLFLVAMSRRSALFWSFLEHPLTINDSLESWPRPSLVIPLWWGYSVMRVERRAPSRHLRLSIAQKHRASIRFEKDNSKWLESPFIFNTESLGTAIELSAQMSL